MIYLALAEEQVASEQRAGQLPITVLHPYSLDCATTKCNAQSTKHPSCWYSEQQQQRASLQV